MRKMTLSQLQSFVQEKECEVNQAVFRFRQLAEEEQWEQLRGRRRARSDEERRALDEVCAKRYQLLKQLGLVSYDKEKRVMKIARLDIL